MVQITDNAAILDWQTRYPLTRFFSRTDFPHHYRLYEKGEFLQTPDHCGHNLHIVLSGLVQIYSMSDDGLRTPIATIAAESPVGELELCGHYVPFYAEAARKTVCLTVSISDCGKYLNEDPVFLHFLTRNLAKKLTFGSNIDYSTKDMNERVLYYLRAQPEHRIDHVETATYDLRCSRSSLQRSLVQLCSTGKIEKLGKGVYQLKQDD